MTADGFCCARLGFLGGSLGGVRFATVTKRARGMEIGVATSSLAMSSRLGTSIATGVLDVADGVGGAAIAVAVLAVLVTSVVSVEAFVVVVAAVAVCAVEAVEADGNGGAICFCGSGVRPKVLIWSSCMRSLLMSSTDMDGAVDVNVDGCVGAGRGFSTASDLSLTGDVEEIGESYLLDGVL